MFINSISTLLNRNTIRTNEEGKYIPENVIQGMMKAFRVPMYDEFNQITYIWNEN